VMRYQLLLGLQTTWVDRVIAEGSVADRVNEDEVGYSFLSDAHNEFHHHGQDLAIHLFSDRCTRGLLVKGTEGNLTRSQVTGVKPKRGSHKVKLRNWDLVARSRLPTLERGRGSGWEPRD